MPDTTATPGVAAETPNLLSGVLSSISSAASTATTSIQNGLSTLSSAASNAGDSVVSTVFGTSVGNLGQSIQKFLQDAQDVKYCWSCQAYNSLFTKLHDVITAMYKQLVEQNASLITFSAIIVMIVLALKIGKIIANPFRQNHLAEWRSIYTYLIRVAIIYPIFLVSATTAGVQDNGQFSPVSDLFISGPLALGSQIGSTLARVSCGIDSARLNSFPACQVANTQGTTGSSSSATTPGSGIGGGGTGSSTSATTPGSGVAGATTPGSFSAMEGQHLALATSILFSFHKIGISGIGAGVWAATQLPSQGNMSLITRIGYMLAGMTLATTYFMLTLTFGFRYVDALIRMFVIGSMLPIFLFLWIFEGTRSIARSAIRQMFFAGASFAVAGLVVTMAAYVMILGFEQAFGAGQGVQAMFDVTFWSSNISGTWDWMKFFYLLGCALIVGNLSKTVFTIAGQLVEAGGQGLLGVGQEMEDQVHSAKNTATNMIQSQAMRR
jgi:hypothetical protein